MSTRFTRQQLIDSLLQEVTRAQASYQAAQLNAWLELAPGTALPAADQIGTVQSIELTVGIKPYTPSWPMRLYRYLSGEAASGETEYVFADTDDPARIVLRLQAGKTAEGYAVTGDEALNNEATQ